MYYIGIVALIVIGPKELPRVMRQLGQAVAKMRRMAAEFRGQFMDAMREADGWLTLDPFTDHHGKPPPAWYTNQWLGELPLWLGWRWRCPRRE